VPHGGGAALDERRRAGGRAGCTALVASTKTTPKESFMADDIYALLMQDHRTIEELFDRCENAEAGEYGSILEMIANNLLPHAKAEEQSFYSKLKSLGEKIEHSYEEHQEAEQMLEECRALVDRPEEFLQSLSQLKDAVMHHVEEEEGSVFDQAREQLAGQETQIAEEFLMLKSDLEPRIRQMNAESQSASDTSPSR
jgi:hemerythrin superfamily protein